jgi:ribose 5-phosphate isomerase B
MTGPSLYIASDHAGFRLKSHLLASFPSLPWVDLGPASADRVDYPDFADRVASKVRAAKNSGSAAEPVGGGFLPLVAAGRLTAAAGVLICGSGQGMAMRANRYPEIRAALGWSEEAARLARAHNDANILCLGERLTDPALAPRILEAFLAQPFEGGRHIGRVAKLDAPF